MAFMWRLYSPMTNRFRLARIFISHWPLDGNRMGVDGVKRGRWDSTLTKRTTPGRTDCPAKGSFDIRFSISRPWQTTISATNGSLRATSARAWAWVIGCRIISVPAAPMLTAPRCFSPSASLVGRKVLWPPTLTPLRKTTRATRFPSTNPLEKLHSIAAVEGPVPGGQIGVMMDRGRLLTDRHVLPAHNTRRCSRCTARTLRAPTSIHQRSSQEITNSIGSMTIAKNLARFGRERYDNTMSNNVLIWGVTESNRRPAD